MYECCLLNHVYVHSFRAFDHLEWTYDGAFEQLFGLGRGEFEQKFSKNSNARGGMLKLRFDWYVSAILQIDSSQRQILRESHEVFQAELLG